MKTLLVILLLLVIGGLLILKLANQEARVPVTRSLNPASATSSPSPAGNKDAQLSESLKKLCETSGGKVSVAVVHVETGKLAEVDASNELPLFSVFKLP